MKNVFKVTMATILFLSLTGCGTASSDNTEEKTIHVTIVKQMDHASLDEIANAIADELEKISEKDNVKISYGEIYSGQNDQATIRQITDQAVNEGADVIIPIATMAAQTAVTSAMGSDTKVVYAAVSDPDSAELTGLDNVTGTSDALNTETVFEMMRQANPDLKKVGLLYSLSEINSEKSIMEAKAYCEENGIAYTEATGNTNDEVAAAASTLISDSVDAVFTPTDNVVMASTGAIAPMFAENRIPYYTGADSFVRNGAFATCGVNYTELGKQTADLAYQVVTKGFDDVDEFYLSDGGLVTVNSETADAVGIDPDTFVSFGQVTTVKTEETGK